MSQGDEEGAKGLENPDKLFPIFYKSSADSGTETEAEIAKPRGKKGFIVFSNTIIKRRYHKVLNFKDLYTVRIFSCGFFTFSCIIKSESFDC